MAGKSTKCIFNVDNPLSLPPPPPPFYSTLEQRAKRLFLTKGVPLGALDPTHFAKTKSAAQEAEGHREIAQMEAMVYKYSELLSVMAVQQVVHFVSMLGLPLPFLPPSSLSTGATCRYHRERRAEDGYDS